VFIDGGMTVEYDVYPLLAAGGPVTFVATKVTKKAVTRNASLPHIAFALQTRQNQGCNYFAPLRSHISQRFSKNLLCPTTAQATIVLPAFARSCSADGKKKILLYKEVCHSERSEESIIGQVLDEIKPVAEPTHPVIAALDHPLFTCGGKKGF
jgi:hypothetical protein